MKCLQKSKANKNLQWHMHAWHVIHIMHCACEKLQCWHPYLHCKQLSLYNVLNTTLIFTLKNSIPNVIWAENKESHVYSVNFSFHPMWFIYVDFSNRIFDTFLLILAEHVESKQRLIFCMKNLIQKTSFIKTVEHKFHWNQS